MRIRLRVALLMAAALLVLGSIALLVNAVTYERSIFQSTGDFQSAMLSKFQVSRAVAEAYVRANPESVFGGGSEAPVAPGRPSVNEALRQVQHDLQRDAARRSRVLTAGAVGVLALVTGVAGWFIAGRVLRPVRLITERARSASADDLTARVALERPNDELKALADTFDSMLDRLERSFAAQRRFSAQMSHELRTPLAVVRSEADLLLAELGPSDPSRRPVESIHAATERAERIVRRLLELAKSESGDLGRQDIALDELTGDVVAEVVEGAEWHDLRVDLELSSVNVIGDLTLVDSLVRNLLDNAARHNRHHGWVRVRVEERGGCAVLEVSNSTSSGSRDDTVGIGLSLVSAILEAHGGWLEQSATPTDSMVIRAGLPTDDRVPVGAR